jgi:hypothetical protein
MRWATGGNLSTQKVQRVLVNRRLAITLVLVAVLLSSAAFAKKNEKAPVPDLVVKAQTVAVLILPDARESSASPYANRTAQQDVEKALMKWGRFHLTQEASSADLVIGVRKGTGKIANMTVGGAPSDTRPGTIETTDSTIRIGVQNGKPPSGTQIGDASAGRSSDKGATTGMQAGAPEDVFEVFIGGAQYHPNSPSLWSFRKTDGLKAPAMSAVEQFRKAVEESEKAMAERQKQTQKKP